MYSGVYTWDVMLPNASKIAACGKKGKRAKFLTRQWLFCRRRQFTLGIYFVVVIYVCLYSRICYNYASDTVV